MRHRPHSKTAFRGLLVALLLPSLVQVVQRHNPHFHPDLMDGLFGVFWGIFFGMVILTLKKGGWHTEPD